MHFSAADLGKVRLASQVDAAWETVLATQALTATGRHAAPVLAGWRARAWAELTDRGLGGAVALLADLAPNEASYFPDLLTPAAGVEGLAACLDALRSTSRERLSAELRLAHRRWGGLSSWAKGLGEGDQARLDELSAVYRALFTTVIEPDWTNAAATVASVGAANAHAHSSAGLESLLGNVATGANWSPPVLDVPYPVDVDVHLRGKGLLLIPSYFCWRYPVALVDAGLDPVLVYPVWGSGLQAGASPPGSGRPDLPALAELMGLSRARVLAGLRSAVTTSDLARALAISAPSVSEHLKALRNGGLVTSRRDGRFVVHRLTHLGAMLLMGDGRG